MSFPFAVARPWELGAFPCLEVVVTAADRAAATCLRVDEWNSGGGASLREAVSPGPPPEEWLGINLWQYSNWDWFPHAPTWKAW